MSGSANAARAAAEALGNTPPPSPAPAVSAAASRPRGLAALAAAASGEAQAASALPAPVVSPGLAAAAPLAPSSPAAPASLALLPYGASVARPFSRGKSAGSKKARQSNKQSARKAQQQTRKVMNTLQRIREKGGEELPPMNLSSYKKPFNWQNTKPTFQLAFGDPSKRPAKKAYNKSRRARMEASRRGVRAGDPRYRHVVRALLPLVGEPTRFKQGPPYGFNVDYLRRQEEEARRRAALEDARRRNMNQAIESERGKQATPILRVRRDAAEAIEALRALITEYGKSPLLAEAMESAAPALEEAIANFNEGEGRVSADRAKGTGYSFYSADLPEPVHMIGLGGERGFRDRKVEALVASEGYYHRALEVAQGGIEVIHTVLREQRKKERQKAQLEAEYRQLNAHLQRLTEEHTAANARKEELEGALHEATSALSSIEERIQALTSGITEAETIIGTLRRGVPEGKKLISDTRAGAEIQMVNRNTKLGRTDREVDPVKAIQQFQSKIQGYKETIAALKAESTQISKYIAAVNKEIKKFEGTLDHLRGQIIATRKEILRNQALYTASLY